MSIKIYDIRPSFTYREKNKLCQWSAKTPLERKIKLDNWKLGIVDLRDNAQITAQFKEKQRNTTAPKHS